MKTYRVTYETIKEEHRGQENPPIWFEKTVEIKADSEQSAIDEIITASPYCITDYSVEEA
jgi:hypothetical protein